MGNINCWVMISEDKECIRIEIHDEVTKTKVISVDMRQSDCIKVLGGGILPRTYCKCQVEEN